MKFKELYDEREEVMAWVILGLGTTLVSLSIITDTVFLGMVVTSVGTMLGKRKIVAANGIELGE